MTRKKLRQNNKVNWNKLPWKEVDISKNNLGEFNDAVFFGLEEIDGSEYQHTFPSTNTFTNNNNQNKKNKTLNKNNKKINSLRKENNSNLNEENEIIGNDVDDYDNNNEIIGNDVDDKNDNDDNDGNNTIKKKKKVKNKNKKNNNKKNKNNNNQSIATNTNNNNKNNNNNTNEDVIIFDNSNKLWNDKISLHNLLVTSLNTLNFHSPTPIQTISIPLILSELCDVVGSAETGSGKTLAFGLPILHSLLNDWENLKIQSKNHHNQQYPYSLILAPTRELAVQISTVLSDISKQFPHHKIQIVNIIGGMSEHKQRRLLCTPYKPVHVIVATPGRFCSYTFIGSLP